MYKFLIGLGIGLLVALPVGVKAWGESRVLEARDYYIDSFTNSGNKCYVVREYLGAGNIAVSCVKER